SPPRRTACSRARSTSPAGSAGRSSRPPLPRVAWRPPTEPAGSASATTSWSASGRTARAVAWTSARSPAWVAATSARTRAGSAASWRRCGPRCPATRSRRASPGTAPEFRATRWGRAGRRADRGRLERDPVDFFQRGLAEQHLGEAVLEHGSHAALGGGGPDDPAVPPLHDELPRVLANLEQLEDPDAPAEAAALALLAAAATEGPDRRERIGALPEHALGLEHPDAPLEVGTRAQGGQHPGLRGSALAAG